MFFGCRSPLPPHQPPPGALVAPLNLFRSARIREIYFPHLSHLRYFFSPVLVPILNCLATSPLATTVHFSISESEYYILVASSASSTQVVIKISTDFIKFIYFSVFSAGSVSSTGTGLVSLTFTISSVVLPISIAALAVTFLFLLLSLLGLDIGVSPYPYFLNIFHTYHNPNEYFLTLYLS